MPLPQSMLVVPHPVILPPSYVSAVLRLTFCTLSILVENGEEFFDL